MCGISGFNWNDEKAIKRMINAIKYRGPDDDGIYVDNEVSLGHVRLSILDLSVKGHQPMMSSDENIVIVHNGEIYNYKEIRETLKKKGHSFDSNTDTEVIINSYKEWGVGCVKKFNGMWAFAIYDKKKKMLFLSRDRLGIKPLYYYWDGDRFIFASELKAILEVRKINRKENLNPDAIELYFALGFIPSPYSIYNSVFKLESRESLIFDLEKKKLKKWYYWDLDRYGPVYNKKKLIDEGKRLLYDTTKLRMRSDVPAGAFLSGGLDSSTVVGVMSKFEDLKDLHTFSIGFEGKYDETKYIEIVSNRFGTIHHHHYYKIDDFYSFINKEYATVYDEPFGDAAGAPLFTLSKIAKRYVTVALSGDGGDEIFGGYEKHRYGSIIEMMKKIPKPVRYVAMHLQIGETSILKEGWRLSLLPYEKIYPRFISRGFFDSKVYEKWSLEKMRKFMALGNNNLGAAMRLFDFYYLSDRYLMKVDRATMSNALENRSPFLDHRFAEYSQKIPINWNVDFFKTKKLMREIIRDMVPKEVYSRGKQGFMPIINEWISDDMFLKEAQKNMSILKSISPKTYVFFKDRVFENADKKYYSKYIIRFELFIKW